MIATLTGILRSKTPTEILIDVQGVGYAVTIPLSTFEKLGSLHSTVTVLTHLHIREDAFQLFGFTTEEERTFFRLLISVSGIGPKIAQGILSSISVADLRGHIQRGNSAALTSIPGIGRKTADRLILELRDKIGKLSDGGTSLPGSAEDVRSQALRALASLGYSKQVAENAVRRAAEDSASLTLEELIKQALRFTGSSS